MLCYLAYHRLLLPYQNMLALHILSVEALLLVFPFTKLMHTFTIFGARWYNGALAGLIAICAGSDLVHPVGALFVGGFGSLIFVYGFQWEQEKMKIDDVLGVWPLHGMIGSWGGIAAGIFGLPGDLRDSQPGAEEGHERKC